ncbi:MAG: Asp-tRNA(Asn)/Glu-tRNA(Gln) amidotransferase subunit GatA [Patescibacteria group bacterium]|nr:Asp-tRNA(Asn)/Glu-tRNA(Gln) amidotransferase subunit GatA [Patescibacteria group bacterium]
MSKLNLEDLTITKAAAAMAQGEFTASQLTAAYLERIGERNENLNAYLEVFTDQAEEEAAEIDQKRERGEELPLLAGIPVAVKDNILIEGRSVSAGSKILAGYKASYDAAAIAKLRQAGAVFLGRTNMDEFAMGSSTENSAFGPTKNSHDESRVPGGSSGGSAVAIAADLALVSLGSDTGGSIRQPASFCGVVGLKPTYGLVSRSGLIAMASSLDQIGPFAKTVEDAELVFDAIKGRDDKDATSLPDDFHGAQTTKKELTIGVPRSFLEKNLASNTLENFQKATDKLQQAGHKIQDIDLPNISYALFCYYVLMPAEASANLARFDGVRYGLHEDGDDLLGDYLKTRGSGFGREVKRRIVLGTYMLSAGYYDAYYGQAQKVARLIQDDLAQALKTVDAIATPTSPTTAFKIGEKVGDPLQMYLADIFTVPANIAGLPAISIPSGKDGANLPLGLQLMSASGQESVLFALGKDYERY